MSQIPYSPYLRYALFTGFFVTAFLTIPRQLFKAAGRPKSYVLTNLGVFGAVTALTLLFVVGMKGGAAGALLARAAGNGIVAVLMAIYLWRYCHFSINLSYLKMAIFYSLPLVPHFLSHWILTGSNQLILERFAPLAEVGIFNLAFTIGAVVNLLALAQNNAILPMYGNLREEDKGSVQQTVRATTYYLAGLFVIATILALLSKEAINLLTPASYHKAGLIVGWIALGFVFLGMYYPLANVLTLVCGNSKLIGISTVISAGINILMNIILVPRLGMLGAAITHATTYFMLLVGVFICVLIYHPLPFEYRRILILLFSSSSIFCVGWFCSPQQIIIAIGYKTLCIFLFPLILFFFKFFTLEEGLKIRRMIRRLLHQNEVPF